MAAQRPVLLLHGFGTSATWQWAPYLRNLLVAGLDPIVVDLLFFGASSSTVPDRSDTFQARRGRQWGGAGAELEAGGAVQGDRSSAGRSSRPARRRGGEQAGDRDEK
ncbi:unnamed protein product [Miscanthus lutarioriparius]|uniref:AB hydrolase-1 domain-containing protein n=1 Tax=Miscanthus lutarioriparius TaxID=422564 RepID=A0A811MNM2_9POAL|nr:unnamed protein product [Miscanthus lutarioriparius]